MTEGVVDGLSAFDLTGRSVLVTGAGRGLGRSMALAIASAGGTVIAVARTAADLNEVADLAVGGRVLALPWDLVELSSLDSLADRAGDIGGPLSGVVHAAGVQHRLPATQFSVEDWHKVASLDLDAPFFLQYGSTSLAGGSNRCSHVFVGSLASSLGIKGIERVRREREWVARHSADTRCGMGRRGSSGQLPCTGLFPNRTHSGSVFRCRTSGVGALEDPNGQNRCWGRPFWRGHISSVRCIELHHWPSYQTSTADG